MRVTLAVVILVIGALCGCASLTHVVWPAVLRCNGTVTGGIVSEVDGIITHGAPTMASELEALGAEYGGSLVACVIEQLLATTYASVSTRETLVMSESLPASGERAMRARVFLASHGVAAP
jgi:hypothetical protein